MKANQCREWLMNAMRAISCFQQSSATGDARYKVFSLYDPAMLLEYSSTLAPPVCGITYAGMSSETDAVAQGNSGRLSFGILVTLASRERKVLARDTDIYVTEVLDAMRNAVRNKISPTQHVWVFQGEFPLDLGDRGLMYVQNWRTQVQL